MRARRYRQKTNWFVPGVVATVLCGLLAWQMDFFPLKVARTETGTLLSELQNGQPDDAGISSSDDPSLFNVANGDDADFTAELDEFGPGPDKQLPAAFGQDPFDANVSNASPVTLPEQTEPGMAARQAQAETDNPFGSRPQPFEFADSPDSANVETTNRQSEFGQQSDLSPANSQTSKAVNPFEEEAATFDDEPNPFRPASAEFSNADLEFDSQSGQPRKSAPKKIEHADYSSVVRQPSEFPAASAQGERQRPQQTRPEKFQPESEPEVIASAAIRQKLKLIDRLLEESDYLTAHSELSRIYWQQPEFRPLIKERIESTATSIYASPQPHYVKPYVVQHGDRLQTIANKYKVPWQYLASLNRVDAKKVRVGRKLKVNKGPFSALIDLSDFEMTIHAHGYFVHRYSVGIGKDGTSPIGKFKVQQKLTNPTWYGPDGNVIDGDDPSNPLGEHWVDLGDSYGIHGTIDPDSIGKASSRGCIRMRNSDVSEVFNLLGEGSGVVIRR